MSFKMQCVAFLMAMTSSAGAAAGDGYILGVGAEADTSDSMAFSTFSDLGLTAKTWLAMTAAKTRAEGAISEL